MNKMKTVSRKNAGGGKAKEKSEAMAYRLKCAKTANGLSHFVMYGDLPKEKTMV